MAGDGGRVPDVSEQRAELEVLRALRHRVIWFGGDDYTIRPWIDAHRLHVDGGRPYLGCPFCRDRFVCLDDPASVLAALLAESPEATVAAIEALLTTDEAGEAGAALMREVYALRTAADEAMACIRRADFSRAHRTLSEARACRSLLSKAPKGDRDA
jgi:hypothetical protein